MMNQPLITVRAPGKVILHGEHAVVYGKKAIACAIDATIQISLYNSHCSGIVSLNCFKDFEISTGALLELSRECSPDSDDIKTSEKWSKPINEFVLTILSTEHKDNHLFVTTLSVLIFAYIKILIVEGNLNFPSLSIHISNTNLPIGAGLGSSAAYSVCLATAFLLYSKQLTVQDNNDFKLDKSSLLKINKLAFCMEKIIHGNPSGVDNSVSTYGGAISYSSGNMKHFSRFPKLNLLVVNSNVSRSTKRLVAKVKEKKENFPALMELLLQSIHEISEAAEQILNKMPESIGSDYLNLFAKHKELIKMNQNLLNCIGVGHPRLDDISKLAEDLGLACKLTGAGGGGCAIILLDPSTSADQVEQLQTRLHTSGGFSSWKAVLGCDGVTIEQCDASFLT